MREIEARGATTCLEGQVDAGADFEGESSASSSARTEIGAAWGRRIPIIALLLGITAVELQVRPGTPAFLKKRALLDLNDIEVYLRQLAARMRREG